MPRPTALVVGVGAEKGLGAALCRKFASGGYHVLVAGRTQAKIDQVAATITQSGGSAEAIATDATDEASIVRLFDRAMSPGDGFDPVDLVVSNAGNNQKIDFREITAQQFEDFWRVGCFSGFLVGREAARRLVPLGRGTIIFTGASASIRGKPGFAHFSAAKAGLRMISQSIAREMSVDLALYARERRNLLILRLGYIAFDFFQRHTHVFYHRDARTGQGYFK